MLIASGIVFGLMEGQGRAERILRWVARQLRLSEDRAAAGVRHVGCRLEDLAGDRRLLGRVLGWAAANWMLDAAALWVFLRAFGASTDIDALDRRLRSGQRARRDPDHARRPRHHRRRSAARRSSASGCTQVDRAARRRPRTASPSSSSRSCSAACSTPRLRVGPWSIERRERLRRLRDIAADAVEQRARARLLGAVRSDASKAADGRRRRFRPSATAVDRSATDDQ